MLHESSINKRHSIRLKDYDYSKEGMYFITICTKNRECLLGQIMEGKINLSYTGKIVEKEFENIKKKFKQLSINIYQVMPNHIHFILEIEEKSKTTIGDVIRYFKGRISSKGKIYWQRNYYEHIIRNEKEYYAICEYIINNPQNWEEDNNYL